MDWQKWIDSVDWVSLGTQYGPVVLRCVLVLVAGHIGTKVLQSIWRRVAKKVNLDERLNAAGLGSGVKSLGFEGPSQLIERVVYWLGVLITIYLFADAAQIDALSQAVNAVLAFLPSVFMALLIVGAGFFGGRLLKTVVTGSLKERMSPDVASIVGSIAFSVVIALSVAIGAEQLGVDVTLIQGIMVVVAGSGALGLFLAIALGGTQVGRQVLARYRVQREFDLRDRVTFDSISGHISRFGPTVLILEESETGSKIVIPYEAFAKAVVIRQDLSVPKDL